jgi:hypothetical protein
VAARLSKLVRWRWIGAAVIALALPGAARAQTCVTPPADLVSWWKGDGSALDVMGANPGTLQGGVTFPAGKVGPSFCFDGVGA